MAITWNAAKALGLESQVGHLTPGAWGDAVAWECETLEELLQWEALERAYWATYYAAQARIVPMSEPEQAQWVESRMRPLYEHDFNQRNVWRAYKGIR